MSGDNSTIPLKCCSKCKQEKPATVEYFGVRKRSKDGLSYYCKECVRVCNQHYQEQNRDKVNARRREQWHINRDALNEKQRAYKKKHSEKFKALSRAYYQNNHKERAERDREYRQRNHEQVVKRERERYWRNREQNIRRMRERYQRNKKRHLAQARLYRQRNRERIAEQDRNRSLQKRHIIKAAHHRRQARKRSLPDTFQSSHWLLCLTYWHHCCAVCGSQLRDLFGNIKPHADHWIALSSLDCPGTIPENMICLCSSCNSSKQDTLPDIWLVRRFGKKKTAEILKRVQDYFEWIKKQD